MTRRLGEAAALVGGVMLWIGFLGGWHNFVAAAKQLANAIGDHIVPVLFFVTLGVAVVLGILAVRETLRNGASHD